VFDTVSCTLCEVECGCAAVQGMKVLLSADGSSEFGRCLAVWGMVHRMSWEGHDVGCTVGARFRCPDIVFNLVNSHFIREISIY